MSVQGGRYGRCAGARAKGCRSWAANHARPDGQRSATIEGHSAGHDEQVLKYAHATKAAFDGHGRRQVVDYAAVIMADEADAAITEERGDFQTAISQYEAIRSQPEFNGSYWTTDYMEAVDAAKMHDTVASRRYLHGHKDHDLFRLSNTGAGWNLINLDLPEFYLAAAADDWRAADKDIEDAIDTPDGRSLQERISVHYQAWPLLAWAEAKTDNLKAAFARIARTAPDCYSCMRMRAQIDIAAKNFDAATWWYARAVGASALNPASPMPTGARCCCTRVITTRPSRSSARRI